MAKVTETFEDANEAVDCYVAHLLNNIRLHDVHASAVDNVCKDRHVVERQNMLPRLESALAALGRQVHDFLFRQVLERRDRLQKLVDLSCRKDQWGMSGEMVGCISRVKM